jgi:glucose/arabinose dehydrogenase
MKTHTTPWILLLTALLAACSGSKTVEEKPAPPIPTPAKSTTDEPLKLTPREISLANGKTFMLNVPEQYEIKVAAEGLKRIRFIAESPDHRVFVTDMLNLTDNNKGTVYILGELNRETGKFGTPIAYLTDLHNPNSIAFHADWLYLALTDKLVRYPYKAGDNSPSGPPQTLAMYPDEGLSYKYGGWHLTRTVVIGPNNKVYVSAGSSCNVCEEKEEIRATVSEMDLDGSNQKIIARGLRNAVGMRFANGKLYVTNMGADHLGDDRPEETVYQIQEGANYGWPFCYQFEGKVYYDDKLAPAMKPDCSKTQLAFAAFPAHSSPLDLEYFDNYFLVALHGSSKRILMNGYRISRVKQGKPPEDFVTGFQTSDTVYGRPAGIFKMGKDDFLFTDDLSGVVYYVHRK